MSKLLDIIHNIDTFSDSRYELAEEYHGYNKPLKIRCIVHDNVFELKQADRLYSLEFYKYLEGCEKCKEEKLGRVEVECAYCGKKIIREKNWNKGNKTNLAFCCREHKMLAQRLGGILVPSHYGTAGRTSASADTNSYRLLAFRSYPHECEICGYSEFEDILEVHHIDEDRSNNNLSNLIILCPNCHKLITLKLFTIQRDNDSTRRLVKIDDPSELRQKEYNKKKSNMVGGFYTNRLIYCVEDERYFSTYMNAGSYYNVSDTTIRRSATSETGLCSSLNKHFKLIDISQV